MVVKRAVSSLLEVVGLVFETVGESAEGDYKVKRATRSQRAVRSRQMRRARRPD